MRSMTQSTSKTPATPNTMAMEIFARVGKPHDPMEIEAAAASCRAAAGALRGVVGDKGARALLAYVLAQYEATPSETIAGVLEKTAAMLSQKPKKGTVRG